MAFHINFVSMMEKKCKDFLGQVKSFRDIMRHKSLFGPLLLRISSTPLKVIQLDWNLVY